MPLDVRGITAAAKPAPFVGEAEKISCREKPYTVLACVEGLDSIWSPTATARPMPRRMREDLLAPLLDRRNRKPSALPSRSRPANDAGSPKMLASLVPEILVVTDSQIRRLVSSKLRPVAEGEAGITESCWHSDEMANLTR